MKTEEKVFVYFVQMICVVDIFVKMNQNKFFFKSLVLPLGTSKVMSSKCLTSSNCRADYYDATLFLT